MNYKKFLGAASAALLIVIAVTLVLSSGALAQSKFKTLHTFTGGEGGGRELNAGLIFDQAGNLYSTTQKGGTHDVGAVFKLSPNQDGSWSESVLYSFRGGEDGADPFAGLIFDQAGNLYGTTFYGGIANCYDGCGVVFELSPNQDGSWSENVLYSFTGGDGGNPFAGMIFDNAGNLYGATSSAGPYGWGVVFKLSPNQNGSWSESVLYSFSGGKDGGGPEANLTFDAAGNLYGTAGWGGACGLCGVAFELSPNADGSWKEKVIHSFKQGGEGGSGPNGLTFDATGNLYGTTYVSGAFNSGTVFKLNSNPDGEWKEKVLHQFTGGKDGGDPVAGMNLIFDATGNLYGTTTFDGNLKCDSPNGCGVVFKLAPIATGGWKETVLHTFAGRPGAFPPAGVIFDAAGNLYGTTSSSVFEITP